MIKATIDAPNGRKLLILGLSFANLDRFRAEPRDTMIKIDGKELGLDIDVMIFSGETEALCAEVLEQSIGRATKILISPRLKQ
jgi:hypothetical protein